MVIELEIGTNSKKKEYNKQYWRKNKERLTRENTKWRENNQEKIKKYREDNKERRKEYDQIPEVKKRNQEYKKRYEQIPEVKEMIRKTKKEYRLKNKERIKKIQEEYQNRPEVKERRRIRGKEYRKENDELIKSKAREIRKTPEYKEKKRRRNEIYMNKPGVRERKKKRMQQYLLRPEVRERNRLNYNQKYNNNDKFRTMKNLRRIFNNSFERYSKTGKIYSSREYGINFTAIIEHLKPFPKDIGNYHIDHIIPLSRFDFNNAQHIKIAFAPENHQWLTIEENLSKGNKLIMPHTYN